MKHNASKALDPRIITLIQEHHVLTVSVSSPEHLWPFHCFYVYLAKENIFVFTTDNETLHGQMIKQNKQAAAALALETKTVGKIQGIQMHGHIEACEGPLLKTARKAYLKAFPYALLKPGQLHCFKPERIKMTDNRLGFGKKILWP